MPACWLCIVFPISQTLELAKHHTSTTNIEHHQEVYHSKNDSSTDVNPAADIYTSHHTASIRCLSSDTLSLPTLRQLQQASHRSRKMESPKSSLKIVRVSSLDEAYELVDVACESFADDPLYALMLPNHKDHPEVFQETWSTNFREDYGKKGSVILAARNVDTGEFVAFAVWVRYGTSYVAQSWQGDTWDKSKSIFLHSHSNI